MFAGILDYIYMCSCHKLKSSPLLCSGNFLSSLLNLRLADYRPTLSNLAVMWILEIQTHLFMFAKETEPFPGW